jgi:hypothetical protein
MSVVDERIAQAVRNNADWCQVVCSAHGSPGEFVDAMWINRGPIPRFYPNAQTITRDPARQLELVKRLVSEPLPAGWALKDSFALLDPVPLGFTALFEAQWIMMPREKLASFEAAAAQPRWEIVRSPEALAEWEPAWRNANGDTNSARIFLPLLLENPDVAIVAGYRGQRIVAGTIGNRGEGVVGWSNFFAGRDEDARACTAGSLAAIARNFPRLPIVGYEEGEMLGLAQSLGFKALGPLRVWVFNGRQSSRGSQ